MSIKKGEASTYVFTEWNTQLAQSPLFNKKLRDKSGGTKKVGDTVVNECALGNGKLEMDLGQFLDGEVAIEEESKECVVESK